MSGILEKISDRMSSFTSSHRQVGSYILNAPDEVSFFTLEEVAERAGVSTTTVIRFARAVDCLGFSQLQRQIREDMRALSVVPDRLRLLQEGVPKNELLASSFKNDINNITLTINSLSKRQLDMAVEKVSGAERIFIVGMRDSFSLAHYAFSRLCAIKEDVRLIQCPGGMCMDELSNAGKTGDVCLAFTFMRYTRHVIDIIKELKRKGVFVLLFTNPNYFAVEDFADIILPCHVNGIGHKNTYAAPICLINYLANAVAALCSKEALSQLEDREDMLMRGAIFW